MRAGLVALRALRELDLLDDVDDALPDGGLEDLRLRRVDARVRDVALWRDDPLDVEVAFDSRMRWKRLVVAGARLVALVGDDHLDVLRCPPGLVRALTARALRTTVALRFDLFVR